MPYGRAGFYIAYTSLPAYQIRKPFIASKEVYKLRGIFPGFDEHKRFFPARSLRQVPATADRPPIRKIRFVVIGRLPRGVQGDFISDHRKMFCAVNYASR